MRHIFIVFSLLVSSMTGLQARVKIKNQGPISILEKTNLILSGSNLNSLKNPFKTKLITADGQEIILATSVNKSNNKAVIYLPPFETGAPSLIKATLAISGGNVVETKAQKMVILLSKLPLELPGQKPPGNLQDVPSIPSNVNSGIDIGSQNDSGNNPGLKPNIGTDFDVNNKTSFDARGINFVKFIDSDTNVNSITSIINGVAGQILIIKFLADVDLVDNDTSTANSIDLAQSGTPISSFYQRDTLSLIFDGLHWSEITRSQNSF
jgi:hypothetical protein